MDTCASMDADTFEILGTTGTSTSQIYTVKNVTHCDFGEGNILNSTMVRIRSDLTTIAPTCRSIPSNGESGRELGVPVTYPWGKSNVQCYVVDVSVTSTSNMVYVRQAFDADVPHCFPSPHTRVSFSWYGLSLPQATSGIVLIAFVVSSGTSISYPPCNCKNCLTLVSSSS